MDVQEMERQILLRVLAHAAKVLEWTWEDSDPEPQQAIDNLRKSVEEAKQFHKLRDEAANAYRASMCQNASGL